MADERAGVFNTTDGIALVADPINPEWVLEGSPQARSGCHSLNTDHWAATHIWDCTAGRFNWHFALEETVLILEGEVHVTDALGHTTVMRPGMLGYFPAGSHWVWHVPAYVRKLSFNRRRVPWLSKAVARVLRAVGVVR
jgi:uncharacterized protein